MAQESEIALMARLIAEDFAKVREAIAARDYTDVAAALSKPRKKRFGKRILRNDQI